MSEVAASAVKSFSLDWNSAYDMMPIGQDHTLEPLSFNDALETNAAASNLKMSVGSTSILLSDKTDDLWTSGEPWHVHNRYQ